MLVMFAIDPFVLSEENSLSTLDALRRIWVEQRICVLFDLTHANGDSYVSEAIKSLPDSAVRRKWTEIYDSAGKRNLIHPHKVKRTITSPWPDNVVKALTSVESIDVLILGQDRNRPDTGQRVDVLSLRDIRNAKKIVSAEDLRGGSVHSEHGDLAQLWRENFQDEFKYATNVHIVDRWVFSNARGFLTNDRPGLTEFIELAKMGAPEGKSAILNIYAESKGKDRTERNQCDREAHRIVRDQVEQSQVKPHPFREVNIYMIPTRDFNKVLGGRHIRFHDIVGATPDHGMELFELTRTVYLNFNRDLEKLQITERRLTDNVSPIRV